MPSKNHLVYRKNVVKCAACGCECTWVKSHQGKPQLTPVWFDHRKQDWFYTTTGNHSNFRQVHDCVADARKRLEELEREVERLGGDIDPDSKEEQEAEVARLQARIRNKEVPEGLGVAQVIVYVERQIEYKERKVERAKLQQRIDDQKAEIERRQAVIAAARKPKSEA